MIDAPGVSRPAIFRLTLACDLKQVREAAQTVHQFLAQHGCDNNTLASCDLALVEGCNNAIKYAPAAAHSMSVKIEAICEQSQVELHIIDHTTGFEWPSKIALPDPESESGRGLFLMQSLMDAVNYLRGHDENILVLRKFRPLAANHDFSASPLMRELEMARHIQQSILLRELPKLPGFELAASCHSAFEVGGDFYDVIKLSDDAALLIIADVMGKGLVAAMFAAVLRTVLRAMPDLPSQPAALLSRINHLLFEELSSADMFITAQVAYLDTKRRKLAVASAGHCPLLIAGGGSFGTRSLSPEGMPLGILPDIAFGTQMVELPRECRVLLYTDGVTEAANAAGEQYGHERLLMWLQQSQNLRTAEDLKQGLAMALKQFGGNVPLNDDQTFLILTAQ